MFAQQKMFTSVVSVLWLLPCLTGLPAPSVLTQTASGGSEVVLTCSLQQTSDSPPCHWVRDGWMVEEGGRFSMRGCDLAINPVLEGDEAEYRCQQGGATPRLSAPVRLKVNIEPGRPHIQEGDRISLERGDLAQLTCQSSGGRPAAELEWWDEQTGQRIVSEVSQHVERTGRTFRTTSTLRTPVSKYTRLFCTAHSEAFPAVKKSSPVELNIRGEPRLEEVQLRAGESVKIFCHNNLRDSNVQFSWFMNDKRIPGETSDVLQIDEFSESYDKSVVKCAAGNDEIIRAVQLTLDKKPKSDIVTFDEVMQATQDGLMMRDEESEDEDEDEIRKFSKQKTTFLCVVEDTEDVSSEPKYVWVNGKLVTNSKATDKNNKSYKCKVVKNGSRKIEKMSKELKSVSKTLRKMSKTLNEFSK